MSEGIEFLLELQANVEGATKMVRELTKMESATHQADAALKAAEKHTSSFGNVMVKGKAWVGDFGHEVQSSFGSMFSALAVFDGLKAGVRMLFEFGAEALHAAGEAERLRLTFHNLLGEELGDEQLDYLDSVAKHTEFTDGQLKSFGIQLSRAGYAGEDFKRAIGGVIDMAAKSENALAGASSAVELLSRMNLKGGLSSRELVSAGISPVKLYARLAGELGIGVKAVEEQLQQGKIKASVLREAFYAELVKPGKNLGDAGVAMANTFEAKLTKVKDIIPNLFEELERSQGLKGITAGLSHLVEVLDPSAPAGKKIIAGLEKLLNWFGKFVQEIDFDKLSDRVVTAMQVIEKAVEYGAVAFEVLSGPVRWMWAFNEALVGIYDYMGDLFRQIFDVVAGVATTIYDAAAGIGSALWDGLKGGLIRGIGPVIDTIQSFGGQIIGSLKDVLGIQSPSKVFAKLGLQTAEGFQLGIDAGVPDVSNTVEQAFGAPPAAPAGGGASGGGARSISIERIEVNVGDVGDRNPRQVGEEIGASLREQIISLLEQLEAEGAGA